MIETLFRPKIQPLFNTLGTLLDRLSFTPNIITACAFSSGMLCAAAIIYDHPLYALFFLIISGLCDVLDGTLARLQQKAHPLGAYIDLIADRMVEAFFIYACAIAYPEHMHAYLIFYIALLLHFTTFVAAGALFENNGTKSMHYDACLIERAEAFMVFGAMLLLPHYITWLLMILNIGIFASAIRRFLRIVHNAYADYR